MYTFTGDFPINAEEKKAYEEKVKELNGGTLDNIISITVKSLPNDEVDLEYEIKTSNVERIRRITGYITGSLDRWNDAKQAEEKDRVKHI